MKIETLKVKNERYDTRIKDFRISSEDKTKFEQICSGLKITVSDALRGFVEAVNAGRIRIEKE